MPVECDKGHNILVILLFPVWYVEIFRMNRHLGGLLQVLRELASANATVLKFHPMRPRRPVPLCAVRSQGSSEFGLLGGSASAASASPAPSYGEASSPPPESKVCRQSFLKEKCIFFCKCGEGSLHEGRRWGEGRCSRKS